VDVTLAVVLAALLLFVTLTKGSGDVVLLFLLSFGLFYGFRPLVFVTGLDEPFPERLFQSGESAELLTKTILGLTLYLAMPFFIDREMDLSRAMKVVLVLTGLAALLSAYLVARYGGVGGVITAAKVDKALAGMYILRTIPAVGAVVATGPQPRSSTRGSVRTSAA
jgi:hypothetical protein